MIVASTIVPVVMRMPRASRCRSTVTRIAAPSECFPKDWRNERNRRLIRRRGSTQIHSGEAAQDWRLIERLFHPGSDRLNHCCKKVSPQHDRQTYRLTTVPCLRVMRPPPALITRSTEPPLPSGQEKSSRLLLRPCFSKLVCDARVC